MIEDFVKGSDLIEWFRISPKRGERAPHVGPPSWFEASMNSGQAHTLCLESSLHYFLPNFKAMLLYNLNITAKDNFLLETMIRFYVG